MNTSLRDLSITQRVDKRSPSPNRCTILEHQLIYSIIYAADTASKLTLPPSEHYPQAGTVPKHCSSDYSTRYSTGYSTRYSTGYSTERRISMRAIYQERHQYSTARRLSRVSKVFMLQATLQITFTVRLLRQRALDVWQP